MNKSEFKAFFEPYSRNVDNAETSYFWRLSDEIVYEIINRYIPPATVTQGNVILDAGGGTGRWIAKLAKSYDSRFVLYDLSEDMLAKAGHTMSAEGIESRVQIIHGDLTDMKDIADNSVNHIVSIYSPLSFIDNPVKALTELYRIVKPNGYILIMGHGFYNSLYSKITNSQAPASELTEMAESSTVKWAPYVPTLQTFSKERMESLLDQVGFSVITSYGVPVFVQPGAEDFDPLNQARSLISKKLETDPNFYKKVLGLELEFANLPTVANRGVNIFSVAKKEK